jgi:hypothetical protein
MPRPLETEYAPFYHNYISLAEGEDCRDLLKESETPLRIFLASISPDKKDFSYAPGKWSLGMLLQHIIDSERIFGYRALCIARGDTQSLPGFDENHYADHADVAASPWELLVEEFLYLRHANALLFASFSHETLKRQGLVWNNPITVNALGFIMVGHVRHHQHMIESRYLTN